jgi:3-oxoacyl-[acyl-carrier-protein] synthase II
VKATPDAVGVIGIGLVSPFGTGREKFWHGLRRGEASLGSITRFEVRKPKPGLAGEVPDFRPQDFDADYRFLRLPRIAQYAVAAAMEALSDGGLARDSAAGGRLGVFVGLTHGVMQPTEEILSTLLDSGPRAVSALAFQNSVHNSIGGELSIRLGLKSHNVTLTSGPSSVPAALDMARCLLKAGRIDLALVIGVEELSETIFHAYDLLRRLSPDDHGAEDCRPFDARRNGIVLAEGAGALLLERTSAASRSGRRARAEIAGIGLAHDRYRAAAIHPEGRGLAVAMEEAVRQARIRPEQVDCVVAAANSSRVLDRAESIAIHKALGARASRVPVTSVKSMLGESFSAASVFNVATAVFVISEGHIPETVHFERSNSGCELQIPKKPLRNRDIQFVLTNAASWGGNQSSVVVRKTNHDKEGCSE